MLKQGFFTKKRSFVVGGIFLYWELIHMRYKNNAVSENFLVGEWIYIDEIYIARKG